MKKKVLLMTAIGLVLLGAVLAAALNAVFTVTDVRVGFSILSEEGRRDADALQSELEALFIGKSTTFLDLDDVRETVKKYPCLEAVEERKDFPSALVLTVSERKEVYAVAREEGGYAILDATGRYLYDKPENTNRRSGENILLQGFSLTYGEDGAVGGDYFADALSYFNVFSERLDDIRANIVSLSVIPTPNELAGKCIFRLLMREGVYVDVYTPDRLSVQKATAVLESYLSLTDAQRLYGFFDVMDDLSGGFTVSEHRAELPF